MPRLFHISDDFHIEEFTPRPVRKEVWGDIEDAVWSVDHLKLQNYLLPRDCPRVCWTLNCSTSKEDEKLLLSHGGECVIFVQSNYRDLIETTKLMMYEFDVENFYLIDEVAGYYISHKKEEPLAKVMITNLYLWLDEMNVSLVYVDNLLEVAESSVDRSFDWSNIRMGMLR